MIAEPWARWLAEARWRAADGVDAGYLAALLARAAVALAGAPAPRKRTRDKLLVDLALAGDAPDHLLKVWDHRRQPLARRLGRSRAARELARAEAVARRGLATPVPLAAGELRRGGRLEASLLLVPLVPGARDLAAAWRAPEATPARRRALARALGAWVRRLHEAGVDQDDLAPNNILCVPDDAGGAAPPRLLAVDFERVRLGRALGRRRRVAGLAKLDRHAPEASAADRLRVLRGYDPQGARRWWRAVAAAHPALLRRDLAHHARIAVRPSRRFAPLEVAGWRGWARREALAAVGGAALAAAAAARVGAGAAGLPGAPLWAYALGPGAGRGRARDARAWAAAQVLAQRGLAPPPAALLRGPAGSVAVWMRPAGALDPGAPSPSARRAALARLCDRLLLFGFRTETLAADAIAFALGPGGAPRALLLDPRGLDPRAAAPDRERRARARAWAAALCGEGGPGGAPARPQVG